MVRVHRNPELAGRLLDMAMEILDREGLEAVTIRACARAADVSHAAPGRHFADRRALLTALAVRCMAELNADIVAACSACADDPRARLMALADASVGYGLVRPQRYRLMWRTDLLNSHDHALLAETDRLYRAIEAEVEALPDGPAATRETKVIALCSALHGYVTMRIDRNFRPASDETAARPRHRAIVDLVLGLSQE